MKMISLFIILPAVLILSACTTAHYTRTENGVVLDLQVMELGSTQVLNDTCIKSSTIDVCIGSANNDSTKGLEAIIAGLIKGASMAVKP